MKTVLVVDDELDIREALKDLLEFEGYRVELARDGKEALAQVGRTQPNAIVLDLMMPVMSGAEFLETFCKRPEQAHIPIIVISALDGSELARRYHCAFVKKPFEFEALSQALHAAMP